MMPEQPEESEQPEEPEQPELLEQPELPEQPKRRRFQVLNGNALKIIALTLMIIDHIGAAVLELGVIEGYNMGTLAISYEAAMFWWYADSVLRAVGRLSFPIYCFLITEGFTHTHNVKKYALRMGIFALLSEIPFDLAFYQSMWYPGHQNVFFTLLLGILALSVVDYYEKRQNRWIGLVAAFGFIMLGDVLHTDYGAFGVFFIVALYAFRNCLWLQTVVGCVLVAWETTAPLAFIPIRMYNGERGRLRLKYAFYAIYPVHLLILYAVCRAIR